MKWLCKPSTKPDITSYIWARRAPSVLASVMLWFVWACRVLSVYQYVKNIYRWLAEKCGFGYVENASGRPDVPPWLGEIYFVCYTVLFALAHHFQLSGSVLNWIAIYYLFESSLWILYYTVFRRFFELGYTIYHQLEYITTIVLMIPTQATCFARLYSLSFKEALVALLGSPVDSTPFIITVFGYCLSAIVIGMIIANFPTENIKKCGKKAKMFVIGCGDVVKKRLYPALGAGKYTLDISIYDLKKNPDQLSICKYMDHADQILGDIRTNMSKNSVVWVSTPPDSHVSYIAKLLKTQAKLIVVEKPVAVKESDLQALEPYLKHKRNKLFFLSYYILEKALPLTYLATLPVQGEEKEKDKKLQEEINRERKIRAKAYEQYLTIENGSFLNHWRTLLGKLELVQVRILEGKDSREWVSKNETGGQLYETFLHNVLIADLFCSYSQWKNVKFTNADYTQKVHTITLKAQADGVQIDLCMQKNMPERSRHVRLNFAEGSIVADLDHKTATVCFDKLGVESKIRVSEEYARNYAVLTDLVGRVFSTEYTCEQVDGLGNQMQILRWLRKLEQNQSE